MIHFQNSPSGVLSCFPTCGTGGNDVHKDYLIDKALDGFARNSPSKDVLMMRKREGLSRSTLVTPDINFVPTFGICSGAMTSSKRLASVRNLLGTGHGSMSFLTYSPITAL